MEFCPKCGTRLTAKSESRFLLGCRRCDYASHFLKEKILEKDPRHYTPSNFNIAVLDRKTQKLRTSPIVNLLCEKCGGNRAETWAIPTGSNGLSGITFYRCVACGHSWRENE